MASLEDRILGEKTHYYCSSSEDEGDDDRSDSENEARSRKAEPAPPPPPANEWNGSATNTGPKGVISDWQRYKQLEAEAKCEQEKERLELMKKLSITCMSSREEQEYKRQKEVDDELDELLDEEILLNYQKQRMREMLAQMNRLPTFGKVIKLKSSDEFLDAIDKEDKAVTVVVHIYEDTVEACRSMNGCLISLARKYSNVKFCNIIGSLAGVSRHFKVNGLPALLIYKSGQMIGNFVRLSDTFGDDFFASDIEGYLIEHGFLLDKSFIPTIISSSHDNDSDVSLD